MVTEALPFGALGIVGLRGCEELIAKVDAYLRHWDVADGGTGRTFVVHASCPRFATGEGKGLFEQSVRGYDLYVLADMFNYGVTFNMYNLTIPMSPDNHFMDLKRIISATNGKARRITVIMPMLYEGRQHRRTARESLDCAVVLQELCAMGVENIITFDAHDPRVQNSIPLKGFENVQPYYQMVKALLAREPGFVIDPEKVIVVSPDEGAMTRNIFYASVLGLNLGMYYKRRDYTTVVKGRSPIVSHEFLGESVEGKDVIIADDMISTGESILGISEDLKDRGARRIFIFATFGLFTDGLEVFHRAYERGVFERVFTTNLVYRPPSLQSCEWYSEVDMSKYIAYLVSTLNYDRSISGLLDPVTRIKEILPPRTAALDD
ncbi:MAG: ribose-phosphate pyrophosphokinase [Oscillospiraceae bacterium]|jgi:ribose-phosphate pyrophosphokinase|nr:ribose-phosphate pyrophosphokinase [Oscillospiraceae bacterium]